MKVSIEETENTRLADIFPAHLYVFLLLFFKRNSDMTDTTYSVHYQSSKLHTLYI